MKSYKILLESSGSLTSSYLIKAVQSANASAVASDIMECAAKYLANEFVIIPSWNNLELWQILEKEILDRDINIVIPSFDETLLEWSQKKQYFLEKGVHIILSDEHTLQICQDKWKTYEFFLENSIPTPKTSLEFKYDVVKPRLGRGGKDVLIYPSKHQVSMDGMISQELLIGQEYTIDVFCNNNGDPVYIIPRKRLGIKNGKSTSGITVNHPIIIKWVKRICEKCKFFGPVNIQCFEDENGNIHFTEINPRVAGGMALGFAASENWISLIIKNLVEDKNIESGDVKYGLKMFRNYDEVYVS
jgi:carbamoyl-phosphate synthase large subunit